MSSLILTYRFTESNCVANMLQISHKQTHIKGIRTKNPINAKCVQLIELHAFACCLLSFFLAALLGSRRVTVVTQQCQAGLPLPSLLGYFTSSKSAS